MLKIVLPLVGYCHPLDTTVTGPTPLAPEHSTLLVSTLVHHLHPSESRRLIVVARRDDRHPSLLAAIERTAGCAIVGIDETSYGTTGALLGARHLLDGDDPLVVAACDQWIDIDPDACVAHMNEAGGDGLILTMPSDDPGATILRQDTRGWATRLVDHQGPSANAVAGPCVFRRGRDFLRAAEALVDDAGPAGCPGSVASVYSVLIEEGARIAVWRAHHESSTAYDLRNASDLQRLRAIAHARRTIAA